MKKRGKLERTGKGEEEEEDKEMKKKRKPERTGKGEEENKEMKKR